MPILIAFLSPVFVVVLPVICPYLLPLCHRFLSQFWPSLPVLFTILLTVLLVIYVYIVTILAHFLPFCLIVVNTLVCVDTSAVTASSLPYLDCCCIR